MKLLWVGVWDTVDSGDSTSKRAKNRFSSSTSEASHSATATLLDLYLVMCWTPRLFCHPGHLVGIDPDALIHSDSVHAVLCVALDSCYVVLQVLISKNIPFGSLKAVLQLVRVARILTVLVVGTCFLRGYMQRTGAGKSGQTVPDVATIRYLA